MIPVRAAPRLLRHLVARISGVALLALSAMSPAIAGPTIMDKKLNAAVLAGELPGLHATIAEFRGARLTEVYFKGEDETWGRPLGSVQHGPETLHDLRSVTKSIVGLLYGIALEDGLVPPVTAPLLAQFPAYADLAGDPLRDQITVEHALTLSMGATWNENLPYSDPRNSEIAMERAPDRYRFVLEQPMEAAPGSKWTYSGGAVALIGKLIADGVGMPIDDFAKARLFDPLGITRFEWIAGADGVPSVASGLRLTANDLTKIGNMIDNNGVADGQIIVPAAWLDASFTSRAEVGGGVRYGYLWYIFGSEERPVIFAAGNGGQRLTVQPSVDLVVTSFAGNYNQPDAWHIPLRVMRDFVVPDVTQRLKK